MLDLNYVELSQRLKTRTLILTIVIVWMVIWVASTNYQSLKEYVSIREYYQETANLLQDQNQIASDYLQELQEYTDQIKKIRDHLQNAD